MYFAIIVYQKLTRPKHYENLKRGELHKEKVYRTTCHVCKTEFEFTRDDKGVRDVFDQRDGNAVVAICPLPNCGNDCWVTM